MRHRKLNLGSGLVSIPRWKELDWKGKVKTRSTWNLRGCSEETLEDSDVNKTWSAWTQYGCSEAQNQFEALQTEQAGIRLLSFLKLVFVVNVAQMALHVVSNGLKISFTEVVGLLLTHGMICVFSQSARNAMSTKPILVGTLLQLLYQVVIASVTAIVAFRMPAEVMQHRFFMSVYVPGWILCSTSLHIPAAIFYFIALPTYIVGWFIFHYLIGFLKPPVVGYALVFSIVVSYARYLIVSHQWDGFMAQRNLEQEHELLKNTQNSLHGILSSIFDASCVCDRYGSLIECTRSLQEILGLSSSKCQSDCGDNGQDGSNICSFTANELERRRLEEFLMNAPTSGFRQAAKVQCSFRSKLTNELTHDAPFEVCLHAIALPKRAQQGKTLDSLFVAVQKQTAGGDKSLLQVDAAPFVGAREASVNAEAGGFSSQSAPHRISVATGQMRDAAVVTYDIDQISLSDTLNYSESNVGSMGHVGSSMGQHVIYKHAATTQTEIHTRNSETQTTSPAPGPASPPSIPRVSEAAKLPRPPLPSGAREASAQENRQITVRRKRRAATSRLNGGLMFHTYSETPAQTISQLVFELIRRINPRCKSSCCCFHQGIEFLRCHIKYMHGLFPCNSFATNGRVQCSSCLCLQDLNDGEEGFFCTCCECEDVKSQDLGNASEVSSGARADCEDIASSRLSDNTESAEDKK